MASPERILWRRDPWIALVGLAAFAGLLMILPVPEPADPPGGPLPETNFAVVDVTVFDGEEFRPHRDVWVEDGRVRAVGARLALPDGLPRVDGRGHTLLPGLIDAHTHTFGLVLTDALRFGVTTVFDQFTSPSMLAQKRAAREDLSRGNEADLFSAGNVATAPGGHGTQFGVPVETLTSPGEAPAFVRERKEEGSDWIKIIWEDGGTFAVVAGYPAPDFEVADVDGDPVTLKSYEGKVLLLNVWATWCGPCREEMPSMQRLYDSFTRDGFEIAAISIDAPVGGTDNAGNPGGDPVAFARDLELTFPILLNPSGDIQRTYRTTGVPESFLIGADGIIYKKVAGSTAWDSEANVGLVRRLLESDG